MKVYIPSSLIVIMSWVSFWLNRGAAPARVGLGVTTVLTMTTLINSVNAALPKISYMKSIDIYLFVCFFMVFGAMVEYACVGYTDKRIQLRKNRYLAMKKIMEEKRQEVTKHMEMQAVNTGEGGGSQNWHGGRQNGLRTPIQNRPQYKQVRRGREGGDKWSGVLLLKFIFLTRRARERSR